MSKKTVLHNIEECISQGFAMDVPTSEIAENILSEIEASPQPAGVRVKMLEWKDGRPDTMQGETKRWEAHTILGWFTACECYGKFWYETPTHKDFNARPAASMAEAKAAAQADYEARILSALEPRQEEAIAAIDGLPNPAEVQRWNAQAETEAYNRLADAQGLFRHTHAQQEEAVALWRHQCAASNFHDHDGCTCTEADLRKRFAHPTPAQKVQESQTVSEEFVERFIKAEDDFHRGKEMSYRSEGIRAALTAALHSIREDKP